MSQKKIITVFGATGTQGGSIVDIFLNDPKLKDAWTVRGVTRDVNKDSSKQLASRGVEVVSADFDDKASLRKAVDGAHTVFAVTNYWEKLDKELEIQQGKNMADAAKEAGVQHYIWSSLKNVDKMTKGVLPNVYHFDSKALVDDYVREIGLPSTSFMAGCYMSNLPGTSLRQTPPDNNWSLSLPMPLSGVMPMYDTAADTGKFVKAIVLHRDELLGKEVLAATKYMTIQEIFDDFKKTFPEAGKTATYNELPPDVFKSVMTSTGAPDYVAQELLENFRLMTEYGYYGGESLDASHAILEDELTPWTEYLKRSKIAAGLK